MSSSTSLVCGIIMPISELDGCSETHWTDVLEILRDAIEMAGFVPNLVSNADDSGVIHKRIIQNLYDNPIAVCDVSGRNPNVMFELGMRLAFNKPTIIIKDDKTNYSFDTSPIEHLSYPRDLRFQKIVDFQEKLSVKVADTYNKSTNDPNYTTFLKHFGEFTVVQLDRKEISTQEYIISELKSLRSALEVSNSKVSRVSSVKPRIKSIDVCARGLSPDKVELLKGALGLLDEVGEIETYMRAPNHFHITVNGINGGDLPEELFLKLRHELKTEYGASVVRAIRN